MSSHKNTYESVVGESELPDDVKEQVQIDARYECYIQREKQQVERQKRLAKNPIPEDLDYLAITGLGNEAKNKLSRYRPVDLGQAARIDGVTPAEIGLIQVHIKRLEEFFNSIGEKDIMLQYEAMYGLVTPQKKQEITIVYDLMILLSGPEPQRTFLEELLFKEVQKSNRKIVFVNGKIEKEQTIKQVKNCTFYNFMQTEQLQKTINESEYILCRSGYTTVMDLVELQKKAFFIPTPGQFEQEYLAKKYQKEGLVGYCSQDKFTFSELERIDEYKGLPKNEKQIDWLKLFSIFQV